MTAGRDEKWHMLIWVYAPAISHESLSLMLRHCDTQVAHAHHCHNEENMLIADSSGRGEIKQSKQHLCCSLLAYGGDGQERREN